MNTEQNFKRIFDAITMLRVNRDDKSILYRLKLIQELNRQIEDIVEENYRLRK